jgi:hypothetical protein
MFFYAIMTINEKALFLSSTSLECLSRLTENRPPSWGKMNAQQMLEHLHDFYEVSIGKQSFSLDTPQEQLHLYRAFLYSEKPFRENTKAPASVLGPEPLPLKTASFEAATIQLKNTVIAFFDYFESNPLLTTMHPVFGELNFNEWIMLHHKHVLHHLRQFQLLA